jgi:hypothetical protein
MKVLILFLALAISVQPLLAGTCAMGTNQEASSQMEQADDGGHDCCDSDRDEQQKGCDGEMQCGFCGVTVSALPDIFKIHASWENQYSLKLSSGLVLPSHSSPPFRPPIS